MQVSEFDKELSFRRVDEERDAAIGRARAALAGAGRAICRDCGEPIEAVRRKAMPSAERCIGCATRSESEEAG